MGAGSSALLWYGLCFGFVAVVVIVATALFAYGQVAETRRREARRSPGATDPAAPGSAPSRSPTALDHTADDR